MKKVVEQKILEYMSVLKPAKEGGDIVSKS